jgi:hypothetical protein
LEKKIVWVEDKKIGIPHAFQNYAKNIFSFFFLEKVEKKIVWVGE